MKYFTLATVFFCAAFGVLVGHDHEDDFEGHYRFIIRERKYLLSDEFELDRDGVPFGTIKKSKIKFPGKTKYQLLDPKGHLEATGITRFFSLGLVWSWGTEIDVYDEEGDRVGYIDGQVFTQKAKFSFYDNYGERVGIAYMDEGGSGFSIKHPDNEYYTLVQYNRKFIEDTIDHWKINVYVPDAIDVRLLKVFAAFAVDRQGNFSIDK